MLNIDNHSKALAFKKFKSLLYKCYPKIVNKFKNHRNTFDMRHLFVILFDCVPNIKNYYSIDRLLKNVNALQVRTGKTPTTRLYSDTEKYFFKKIFNKKM